MLTYKQAEEAILKAHSDQVIEIAIDMGKFYGFFLQPKDHNGETMIDNSWGIDKQTGEEVDFNPMSDPRAFSNAMKNKVMYRMKN